MSHLTAPSNYVQNELIKDLVTKHKSKLLNSVDKFLPKEISRQQTPSKKEDGASTEGDYATPIKGSRRVAVDKRIEALRASFCANMPG